MVHRNDKFCQMISSFVFVNQHSVWFWTLIKILWFVLISKPLRISFITISRTNSSLCIYHSSSWLNFNLLYNSYWITFPTQSCLLLNSFCYFKFLANAMLITVHWHHMKTFTNVDIKSLKIDADWLTIRKWNKTKTNLDYLTIVTTVAWNLK